MKPLISQNTIDRIKKFRENSSPEIINPIPEVSVNEAEQSLKVQDIKDTVVPVSAVEVNTISVPEPFKFPDIKLTNFDLNAIPKMKKVDPIEEDISFQNSISSLRDKCKNFIK